MMTDPIADMLSRIRNANRAVHESTSMPSSKLKEQIARILKDEGYIKDYRILTPEEWKSKHPNAPDRDVPSFDTLVVDLKFGRNRERILTDLKRVSKPGRRVYARKDRLPRVLGGMGVAILSTSTGIVTARTAQERGVGGEVICFVW
jgi:small subunit ribosomal protein S8